MEDRQHHDSLRFDEEMNGVWKAAKERPPNLAAYPRKAPRILHDPPENRTHFILQFPSEPDPADLVPRNGFGEFEPGERPEEDGGIHPRGA